MCLLKHGNLHLFVKTNEKGSNFSSPRHANHVKLYKLNSLYIEHFFTSKDMQACVE